MFSLSTDSARAAVALVAVVVLAGCSRSDTRPEPVRSVRTIVAAAAPSSTTIEYAAEIRARTETRLGFRVGGKLVSRPAEVGQRVRAGQVLASLDPEDLRLGQESARAALHAAQVQHELALADHRRFKELRDQGFISGAEFERREAALKAAAAQLEQARAQAAVQRNQAAYADLTSPAGGVVVAVDAEPGAVLSPGAPVLRLAVDGPRDAVFAVPEHALAAVRALTGQRGALRVVLWGAAEAPLAATVRELAAAADPVTRTFAVKAELVESQPALGRTATVVLSARGEPSGVRLPLVALREYRGGSAVWVVDPTTRTVKLRSVTLGDVQGNEVSVLAGLNPGERVVTAGVHVLTEGQAVRLLAPEPAASAASR